MEVPTVYAGELYLKGLPQGIVSQIKEDLTLPNPKYQQALAFGRNPRYATKNIPQTISYYREPAPGVISVPRGYPIPLTVKCKMQYRVNQHPIEYPESNFTPRDWQRSVSTVWGHVKEEGVQAYNYTAVAPPGSGKTVAGLFAAKTMGQRTLVLVPTSGILDSWITDIKKMFGDSLRYKIWKGKASIKPLTDEHIVIAMIATLRNADVTVWGEQFGMVVVDEAHKCPASTVFRLLENCNAAYRFGITATPERTDKLEKVIFWACGPVRTTAQKDLKATVPLKVHKLHTEFKISKPGLDMKQSSLWLRQMRLKKRVDAITELVYLLNVRLKIKGPVLVVCSRVELCDRLSETLYNKYGLDAFHFKSTLKGDDREAFFDEARKGLIPVTVATTQMLAEGVNVPPWKHLIITQSFSASTLTRQVIGRVERAHPGKDFGHVWDIVDNCDICRRQYDKRALVYARSASQIKKYTLEQTGQGWKPVPLGAKHAA